MDQIIVPNFIGWNNGNWGLIVHGFVLVKFLEWLITVVQQYVKRTSCTKILDYTRP